MEKEIKLTKKQEKKFLQTFINILESEPELNELAKENNNIDLKIANYLFPNEEISYVIYVVAFFKGEVDLTKIPTFEELINSEHSYFIIAKFNGLSLLNYIVTKELSDIFIV